MNDIRVKIVETPRNPSGEVPAPLATDGAHHNEVDPLAFDDTDLDEAKHPLDPETGVKDSILGHHEVKVDDACDENAKEKIVTSVQDASESVKDLEAGCEKIIGKCIPKLFYGEPLCPFITLLAIFR